MLNWLKCSDKKNATAFEGRPYSEQMDKQKRISDEDLMESSSPHRRKTTSYRGFSSVSTDSHMSLCSVEEFNSGLLHLLKTRLQSLHL